MTTKASSRVVAAKLSSGVDFASEPAPHASFACTSGDAVSIKRHGPTEEHSACDNSTGWAQAEQLSERSIQDEQLIIAVAQGDPHAFEMIYDRYAPTVFGLACKMLGQLEAAEEAVQEIFWRVWQRAGSFDRSRSFAPWLLSIAHNYCIDELRRQHSRPQPVYEDEAHPMLSAIPDDTDVADTALHTEQRRILLEALQQLPHVQRQALELVYFSGLTQQEIADRLGHPLGTIKTRKRLGLQKIRNSLQGLRFT